MGCGGGGGKRSVPKNWRVREVLARVYKYPRFPKYRVGRHKKKNQKSVQKTQQ